MITATTEANKDLVRRYTEEVFNNKRLAAIDEFLAPDLIDHTLPPSLPPTIEGSKQAISMYLKAFPDLRATIDDLVAEGDKVVCRFTSHGTQRGAFGALPSMGRRVHISSYLIARVRDGKIVEMWGLDDQLAMLRQLGVIPALLGSVFLAGLGAGAGLVVLLRKRTT
jgi:predicted ester cyclase